MSEHGRSETLSELEIRILTILGRDGLHGYGVAKQLQEDQPDGPTILPTNLYRRLHELVARGLIANADLTTDDSGRPRKNFTLTAVGRERLGMEAERLAALVREIESQALSSPRSPAE